MPRENDTILIVDDEPHVISALRRGLDEDPFEITGAGTGTEALELMAAHRFKVVISDEKMPGMSGAEFLGRVKELHPESIRIMLTGHASVEATMRAVNRGEIYRFFTKPWNDTELRLAIRSALEKYDMEQENQRLLRTVKRQSQELRYLEKSYPGISEIRKDNSGAIEIETDLSEAEIADIIAQCNVVGG
jgi:two-component system, probable response regulator PhcQ